MKGITTSNAHFLELDKVGPDCSVSDECSRAPRIERQSDLSIYLTNIIFTKFVDLAENLKPAITLGGLSLIQFKWISLYFRSENRLFKLTGGQASLREAKICGTGFSKILKRWRRKKTHCQRHYGPSR